MKVPTVSSNHERREQTQGLDEYLAGTFVEPLVDNQPHALTNG